MLFSSIWMYRLSGTFIAICAGEREVRWTSYWDKHHMQPRLLAAQQRDTDGHGDLWPRWLSWLPFRCLPLPPPRPSPLHPDPQPSCSCNPLAHAHTHPDDQCQASVVSWSCSDVRPIDLSMVLRITPQSRPRGRLSVGREAPAGVEASTVRSQPLGFAHKTMSLSGPLWRRCRLIVEH